MYNQVDEILFEGHWHHSRIMIVSFVTLLIIVLCIIAFVSLSIYWQVLLGTVLLIYSASIFFKNVLFGLPSSFTAIRKTSNNWFIYNEEKKWQVIKLCPDHCLVLSKAIVLVFCYGESHQRFHVCLLKSNFLFDDFRQLVVFLRYGLN